MGDDAPGPLASNQRFHNKRILVTQTPWIWAAAQGCDHPHRACLGVSGPCLRPHWGQSSVQQDFGPGPCPRAGGSWLRPHGARPGAAA